MYLWSRVPSGLQALMLVVAVIGIFTLVERGCERDPPANPIRRTVAPDSALDALVFHDVEGGVFTNPYASVYIVRHGMAVAHADYRIYASHTEYATWVEWTDARNLNIYCREGQVFAFERKWHSYATGVDVGVTLVKDFIGPEPEGATYWSAAIPQTDVPPPQ